MRTIVLLIASNLFMTFAWYTHLKNLQSRHWLIAVMASWGIVFFEYLLQVPANRIGFAGAFSLPDSRGYQFVGLCTDCRLVHGGSC